MRSLGLKSPLISIILAVALTLNFAPANGSEPRQQSQQTPAADVPPELHYFLVDVLVVGIIVANAAWISVLRSHRSIRHLESLGAQVRHSEEGYMLPALGFSNDWRVECKSPDFKGSAADLSVFLQDLKVVELVVEGSAEKEMPGTFLHALSNDPLRKLELENVVLDQQAVRAVSDNSEQLSELRISSSSLGDSEVKELRGCRHISSLQINSDGMTDEGLAVALETMQDLDSVELSGNRVTGRFLERLDAKELTWLFLSDCDISNSSLRELHRFPALEHLAIRHSGAVTNKGLKYLSSLPELFELDLSGTGVNRDGIVELAQLPKLDMLLLSDCGISDDSLSELHRFPALRTLSISHSAAVTDRGMAYLSSLSELSQLDLSGTGISSAGLIELAGVPNLDTLVLDNCSRVDHRCLDALCSLPELLRLSVIRTGLSREDLQRLQERLPNCEIESTESDSIWTLPWSAFTGRRKIGS